KAEEHARVKAGLTEAAELRKQGKASEANARLAELTKQYPESPVVQYMTAVTETTQRRDEAQVARKDKERGTLDGLNSIDRAATMPKGDIEFAKDFKERTAKRKADTQPTA